MDASAAISALLNAGAARRALADEEVHVPDLVDAEVANGLRGIVARGRIATAAGWRALDTWRRLGVVRYPTASLLERIWQLRTNLSSYEAAYVALAEELQGPLLTADRRLARAPGVRCPVTVLPD